MFRSIKQIKNYQNVQKRQNVPNVPVRNCEFESVLDSTHSQSKHFTGRKRTADGHMEIKQSLQEEELQQITGSASICKMVKPLPTAELMNSSGRTEQTSVSHRGYSSLVVISETVVELICLLSCTVPARVCLGKSKVK